MNRNFGDSVKVATAGIAAAVTVVFALLALYPRYVLEYSPLTLRALAYLPIDVWSISNNVVGIAMQLLLTYLVCLTPPFRRFVTGRLRRQDTLWLVGIWSGLYLLTLVLHLYPQDWFASGLLLFILLTGYVGGWQAGLVAGITTTLVLGTYNLFDYGGLTEDLQANGLWSAIMLWSQDFALTYLYDQYAAIYIWIGLMSGLIGHALENRRWSPVIAAITGVLIALAAGYLVAINVEDPSWETEYLAPRVVASGVGLAIVVLIVNAVQAEAARQRAAAAELAKTRAELQALRAQINPHFLFNSLNTIRYFVRTDPANARRLLVDLSDIFQHALRSGEFVPLRDELRYVEAYLALEKARLDVRLQINWTKPDAERLGLPVPTLILQPVVENAVIHGIAKRPEGGVLDISIVVTDGHLQFCVRDSGTGIDADQLARLLVDSAESGKSIGLRNINNRLMNLYGAGFQLMIESARDVGTTVRFQVPILDKEQEPVSIGRLPEGEPA